MLFGAITHSEHNCLFDKTLSANNLHLGICRTVILYNVHVCFQCITDIHICIFVLFFYVCVCPYVYRSCMFSVCVPGCRGSAGRESTRAPIIVWLMSIFPSVSPSQNSPSEYAIIPVLSPGIIHLLSPPPPPPLPPFTLTLVFSSSSSFSLRLNNLPSLPAYPFSISFPSLLPLLFPTSYASLPLLVDLFTCLFVFFLLLPLVPPSLCTLSFPSLIFLSSSFPLRS